MPKVLAIRLDQVGDLIQTLPAIANLSHKFNNLGVLCLENNLDLLHLSKIRANYFGISLNNNDEIISQLAAEKYDVIINFVNSPAAISLFPKLIKIAPTRIGKASFNSSFFFYNKRIIQGRHGSQKNEAFLSMELLRLLLSESEINFSLKPKLTLDEAKLEQFKAQLIKDYQLGRFVLVNLGSGRSALNWPISFYIDLIRNLVQHSVKIVLSGSTKAEAELNKIILEQIKTTNIVDLTGKFGLVDFCYLLKSAQAVLAPSTGTIHLASALGCKCISLYPPIPSQSHYRWAPYKFSGKIFSPNVPCPAKYKCKGISCRYYNCLDEIKAAQVSAEILRVIN